VAYRIVFFIFMLMAPALAQPGRCISTPGADGPDPLLGCEVQRRGSLGGGLAWEVQRRLYQPPRPGSGDMTLRMMVVHQGGAAVAWTEPSYGNPQYPEQLATSRGLLLRLPVTAVHGSGTPLDEVWLRRDPLGDWVHLDARGWRSEAEARLSPGEGLTPVHRLELRPVRATGRITRPGDPPGRASGGSYTAWLDLGEDRLVLTGFSRR
jgi:hypothetical protein